MAIEVYGAGGASKEAEQKTVTPTTSQQIVTPTDEDHELTQVTVNAMPSGALAAISVSTSGLITGKVSTSGYLAANTSKTKQLTTKAGQSYTPGTEDKTIVNSGVYTTGAQVVKGDANLIPENIGKGKSIFGVNGIFSSIGSKIWEKYILLQGYFVPKNGTNIPIPNFTFSSGGIITYNDKLYIFDLSSSRYWFNYDGNSWTQMGQDYNESGATPIIYRGDLYMLGGSSSSNVGKYLRKWNEAQNKWDVFTTTLPFVAYNTSAVVYNDEIHIFGSTYSSSYQTYHYKWDGTTWTQDVPLVYGNSGGGVAFVYNNKIHFKLNLYTYRLDGDSWTLIDNDSATQLQVAKNPIEYNGEIFITQRDTTNKATKVYSFNGTSWDLRLVVPFDTGGNFYTTVYNGEVVTFDVANKVIKSLFKYGNYPNEFIGFVVGNENDFPDYGEQDGYWYIANKGYATGTFTTPSGSSQTITLPHNLGKIPSVFAIVPTALGVSSSYECIICVLNNNVVQYKNQYGSKPTVYNTKGYTADEQNITISGYWGGTYTWIVV